jgi:GNAT superfamily N-acetyltransferase
MSRRRRHRTSQGAQESVGRAKRPAYAQGFGGCAPESAEAFSEGGSVPAISRFCGGHGASAFALRASADKSRLCPPYEEAAVSIRIAQSDDDIVAIHRFMIAHAAPEMAEAEVDTLIYMQTIHDTVTQGAGLIAVIGDEIAGYLGLWKSQYDYSQASFLHDRGFYVLPAHRGAVGAALLREARIIADDAGLALKIIDTNPRKRRCVKSRIALTAEIIGYAPAGRIITFHPSEA